MPKEEVKNVKKELVLDDVKKIPKVDEVPLIAHERDTGCKAIVDLSTMETICVVKKDNQIIQHQQVYNEVSKLENYVIKRTLFMNGGQKMMIEVTERTPKKIELLPNDFLECGARIFNDYGKSRGLSVAGYGMRLICENGVVAPKVGRKMQIFAYGTSEFAKELEEQIAASIAVWQDTTEIMERANETTVHVKDILEDIDFLPKKYMKIVTDKLKDEETLYNIWNEYTRVITHEIGPKVKTQGLLSLQKMENKILTIQIEE